MLKELYIKNMAVIDEIRVSFDSGFQVLTGETGAGKTILVEAIGLILGNKASNTLIRDGEDEAVVEASFAIAKEDSVKALLEENALINAEDQDELIIKRHLSPGKNRIFVNHQRASLSFLQQISELLIDFTGQHEQIELLNTNNDIHLFDSFLSDKKGHQNYVLAYENVRELYRDIQKLRRIGAEKTERLEWLGFQIKEFKNLKIHSADEEAELKVQRERLKNQHTLSEFEKLAAQTLTEGPENAVDKIKSLRQAIEKTLCLKSVYAGVLQSLEEVQIQLEDTAYEIAKASSASGIKSGLNLDEIESRLYQVEKLKRKYGPEIENVLQKQAELEEEIATLKNSDEILEKQEKAFKKGLDDLREKGLALSGARQKIKGKLEDNIKKELAYLQMPSVRFEIQIDTASESDLDQFESYQATGIDRVAFLLSPNPGLSPRPLAKIASGGETSRIFLALKQVLSQSRKGGTLIFDEIDTGISGAAVELVGNKLKSLAKNFQVFCVTHHAQIASQADQHFKVQKKVAKNKTIARVHTLSDAERVQEIARLMGGVEITKKNVAYAKEMLSKNRK